MTRRPPRTPTPAKTSRVPKRLRAIGGLDFRAIAETVGISEENARVTFSQAKKKLIARLSPGGAS